MKIIFFFLRESLHSFYQTFSFLLRKSIYLSRQHTYLCSPLVSRDTEIGNYVYIWHQTAITRTQIGNYCSIASNVSIGMGEHDMTEISTNSIFYKNQYDTLTKDLCIIGHDVWIGVDAIVRRWVTIGNGAVIGANSFVNRDVPAYAIVVGSPAKIIRSRFTEDQIELIEESKWWLHDKKTAIQIMRTLIKKIHA